MLSLRARQAAQEHLDFGAQIMENSPKPSLNELHHLISYHLLTGVSNTLNKLAQPKSSDKAKPHP